MSSPPRLFHDLHGLERTIPPPARVPSPALRDEPTPYIAMPMPEQFARRRSPSPTTSSRLSPPTGYSAWERRGHRRPSVSSSQPMSRGHRSARSLSPRMHPIDRSRTPPALEPPSLHSRQMSHAQPEQQPQRFLQPSDAEIRREREEMMQQQQFTRARNNSAPSYPTAITGLRRPSPGPVYRLDTTTITTTTAPTVHTRTPSNETVSPLSADASKTPPFSLHTPKVSVSAGEANLAKIGAPRPLQPSQQRRAPRRAIPSMCDYLSLDELEGLWAEQDLFVGSVPAPQAGKKAACPPVAPPTHKLSLFPTARGLPVRAELGMHPAFRGGQMAMV